MKAFPKRLIEVDLPIKRVSEQARREKDMRRGHVPLLYIWPATRPPAACRAVICASLWPDPADPQCPQTFRAEACHIINEFARKASREKDLAEHCSHDTWTKWQSLANSGGLDPSKEAHWNVLRFALLDFIADFANWDNSVAPAYLETSHRLTHAAHQSLGGASGSKPLVLDPFAGGGAIPLEALRVGADAFASELNPVAVLYEKMVLEYVPRYGKKLARELESWVRWANQRAQKELADFYPGDDDGTPIAYLWARTVICEGPACGSRVPLIRGLWLANKGDSVALRLIANKKEKRIDFEITQNAKARDVGEGTVRRGGAICPVCGFTTPASRVRTQLKARKGGASDAELFCVVTTKSSEKGRFYRLPRQRDLQAIRHARDRLEALASSNGSDIALVPDEVLPVMSGVFNAPLYGHNTWGTLFNPRQALMLSTFARLAREYISSLGSSRDVPADAVACTVGLFINRLADLNAALCVWQLSTPNAAHVFGRWALPMVMDFAEVNPLAGAGGSPESIARRMIAGIEYLADSKLAAGTVQCASATHIPLPDESVNVFMTDPPYYNAVPYADLSDFFYVWLKRTVRNQFSDLFTASLSPKEEEICEMAGWDRERYGTKDKNFFEREMGKAMAEGRRVLAPNGIGVVVFAHKSTSGWEALLQSMIGAGWTITASWPIDTEMASRLRAKNSAALASSVHLVCRPRDEHATPGHSQTGDWRDVLTELPKRIHEWMPRLGTEGIVGADAIFACIGPALEIFSKYARVEKGSGEEVTLKEYLECVWAAVAKEALNMIFEGADATGFEEDARVTAMWLWTLSTGPNGSNGRDEVGEIEGEESASDTKLSGFVLEYDAARKIAQGLGAHLEEMNTLVQISGEKARLLPVAERARHLFGKDHGAAPRSHKGKPKQLSLLDVLGEDGEQEVGSVGKSASRHSNSVLDAVHQSMILFGAGRGEALKRFLVNEAVGQDERFWRLAQALAALYPKGTDEKRWVEGVLARKKGLGF